MKALFPSIVICDPDDIHQYSTYTHDLAILTTSKTGLPPRAPSARRAITPSELHLKFDFSVNSHARDLHTDRPSSIQDILNAAESRIEQGSPRRS